MECCSSGSLISRLADAVAGLLPACAVETAFAFAGTTALLCPTAFSTTARAKAKATRNTLNGFVIWHLLMLLVPPQVKSPQSALTPRHIELVLNQQACTGAFPGGEGDLAGELAA